VTTLNPFRFLESAMTRQPPGGGLEAFLPEQVPGLEECLLGSTAHAADAAWRGQDTGRLTPGRISDLVVLDRAILTCDACAFGETEVLLTLVDGTVVWRAAEFDG